MGDSWAIGLVFLEVLCGSGTPHAECTTLAQLSSKVWQAPQNYSEALAKLPEPLRHPIEACFNPAPRARPTPQQLLQVLDRMPDTVPRPVSTGTMLFGQGRARRCSHSSHAHTWTTHASSRFVAK